MVYQEDLNSCQKRIYWISSRDSKDKFEADIQKNDNIETIVWLDNATSIFDSVNNLMNCIAERPIKKVRLTFDTCREKNADTELQERNLMGTQFEDENNSGTLHDTNCSLFNNYEGCKRDSCQNIDAALLAMRKSHGLQSKESKHIQQRQ